MTTRYGLEIRAATPADAPALADLLALASHPIPAAILAPRLSAIQAAPGTTLLALEWGPPSGVVAIHWHPTLAYDQPAAHISTLLVAPEARRRGIARLLLKAAAQAARSAGCNALTLTITADQPGLRAFCAANGFDAHGEILSRALRKK